MIKAVLVALAVAVAVTLVACEVVGDDLRKICRAAESAVQGVDLNKDNGELAALFASRLDGIEVGKKTQRMMKDVAVAKPASKYQMMLKFARENGEGFWSCPALERIWAPAREDE
jgi:hypothetical protein